MKPFEWVFTAGVDQAPGEKNVIKKSGQELTVEEKKLLAEYLALYIKEVEEANLPGSKNLVNIWISGFYAGIGHAGTHFKNELLPPHN